MEYAKLRGLLKDRLDTLDNLPIVYVISQFAADKRCKIGLSTDYRQRYSSYRTALVTCYTHALMVCKLSNLPALERQLHKLVGNDNRIEHTR